VPCAQSRETVKRSEFAGFTAYGYCAAHSRPFWGFRLYLVCAPDGMPVGFELAPANLPEREVAEDLLARLDLAGRTVIADKGFAGEEFEQIVASVGARLVRPDRNNEPPRFGSLGPVRQWIESIVWSLKGQLSLERHGSRTPAGLVARIAPTIARTRCRRLAQLGDRRSRPSLHRLRPLIRNQASRRTSSGLATA
jgi:Transposase DDE domain